jgi:hypothetical protein
MACSVEGSIVSSVDLNIIEKATASDPCPDCEISNFMCQKTFEESKSAQLVIESPSSEVNSCDGPCDLNTIVGLKSKKCMLNDLDRMKHTCGGNKPIGSEVDQLELEQCWDVSEIHELYRMAVSPRVRQTSQKVIMNMEESLVTQKEAHTIQNRIIPKISYSEILVYTGINKEPKEVVQISNPTIITSRFIRKENKIHRLTPQK